MEVNNFKEALYEYSTNFLFEESSEYISNCVNFYKTNSYYEKLDNIFYSIDLKKLNATIALQLIEETLYICDRLAMRKFFIENCKKSYTYKKNIFVGY